MESNNVFAVNPPDTGEAIGNGVSHCAHRWVPATKEKVVPFPIGGLTKMKQPNTKIIIIAGLCQTEVVAFIRRGEIDAWLFKPFGFAELKTTLANIGNHIYNMKN